MTGSITVLFFATAREATGRARIDRPVDAVGIAAERLVEELSREYPKLVPILKESRWVLNGDYIRKTHVVLRRGDEFAIHPPYSGG